MRDDERERETERDREKQREIQRERQRETERETDRWVRFSQVKRQKKIQTLFQNTLVETSLFVFDLKFKDKMAIQLFGSFIHGNSLLVLNLIFPRERNRSCQNVTVHCSSPQCREALHVRPLWRHIAKMTPQAEKHSCRPSLSVCEQTTLFNCKETELIKPP